MLSGWTEGSEALQQEQALLHFALNSRVAMISLWAIKRLRFT